MEMKNRSEKEIAIRKAVIRDINSGIPIDQIRVTNIAEKTGISRSSFYFYYDSVYDVVQQIEDDFIDSLHPLDHTEANSDTKITKASYDITLRTLLLFQDHEDTMRALLSQNGDVGFAFRLLNRLKKYYYRVGTEAGMSKEEAELYGEYTANGNLAIIKYYIFSNHWMTQDQFMKMGYRLLFGCLNKNPGT